MNEKYQVIDFHQYGGSAADSDRLLMFAAKAKDIAAWAGIPRKGWRIRMLFQRWMTESRKNELVDFFGRASTCDPENNIDYVVCPTAIIVAIQGNAEIVGDEIHLKYDRVIDPEQAAEINLKTLSDLLLPQVKSRLDASGVEQLEHFSANLTANLQECGHNYVLEFGFQLVQMSQNTNLFIEAIGIPQEELPELLASMEALCRPALVVDGQHRLMGAASVEDDIMLPVVALTNASWIQQIYQFVVINEKAAKVDSELLNDIFASSLTPCEQDEMRENFSQVKVDIEQRIAGVLAGRDSNSPFFHMVRLNLPNRPESEAQAFISQKTIQHLIEGGRGSLGWRSHSDFYEQYVKLTYPAISDWGDWRTGKWKEYWFTFWATVREFYKEPARRQLNDPDLEIWGGDGSNLTKGVALKIFQRFFMEVKIEDMIKQKASNSMVREMTQTLVEAGNITQEEADQLISKQLFEYSIPLDLGDFAEEVKRFLDKIPVRFFTANWEASLDDSSGQDSLLFQMREAYSRDNWRARGGNVFRA